MNAATVQNKCRHRTALFDHKQVGKERGADPDNPANREKTILVKAVSAGHGIPAERLLARVGLARSTYYHQLNAMNRPDRDEGLLVFLFNCLLRF